MQDQERLFQMLTSSQRIFIALPANPNGDTLGSSLALAAFLRKMNKEVDVYCQKQNFGNLSFLPGISEIKHQINLPKSFVITVSTDSTKLDELSYNVEESKVNIYLKPKQGTFSPENVSFGSEVAGYNLVICLDTPSLGLLGALYESNAELFFQTAKINIDNHVNNENYGNINIVDITASSTSEILLELLKSYEANLIDENIATSLLTGIISETNSFQHNKTTPNSFLKASELIALGAKQQEIIRNLFKTKTLAVLKLWGRAMARIRTLPEYATTFSVVGLQDIEKSEAREPDILKVAEDFMANISDAKLLFFVAERPGFLEMYASSNPNIKLKELVQFLGGEFIGDNFAKIIVRNVAITDVENFLVDTLQKLKPRLGL